MAKPEFEPNWSDSELILSRDGLVSSMIWALQENLGPGRLKFLLSGPWTQAANLHTSSLEHQSSGPLLSYSLRTAGGHGQHDSGWEH